MQKFCGKNILLSLQRLWKQRYQRMSGGVIGNTSDFGSEESRFEPWPDNIKLLN